MGEIAFSREGNHSLEVQEPLSLLLNVKGFSISRIAISFSRIHKAGGMNLFQFLSGLSMGRFGYAA